MTNFTAKKFRTVMLHWLWIYITTQELNASGNVSSHIHVQPFQSKPTPNRCPLSQSFPLSSLPGKKLLYIYIYIVREREREIMVLFNPAISFCYLMQRSMLFQCIWGATTKYYRLGSLQTTEIYFLQFWRLKVQDQGANSVC